MGDSDSSSLEGQKPAIKVENIGSSKQGKAKVTTTTKKITTTTTTTTTWPDPWEDDDMAAIKLLQEAQKEEEVPPKVRVGVVINWAQTYHEEELTINKGRLGCLKEKVLPKFKKD